MIVKVSYASGGTRNPTNLYAKGAFWQSQPVHHEDPAHSQIIPVVGDALTRKFATMPWFPIAL